MLGLSEEAQADVAKLAEMGLEVGDLESELADLRAAR